MKDIACILHRKEIMEIKGSIPLIPSEIRDLFQ